MASSSKKQLSDQEISLAYQSKKNELQTIAQKIGELESDAEEHTLVTETLEDAHRQDPDRKCFRMIGGVLVERTVKEVLPALKMNLDGIKGALQQLVNTYKAKETEFVNFQREHGIQVVSKQ